jgi:predicted transcriptional regulator
MATAKELVQEVVKAQPEDASYEEIMRELAFDRMVARGLRDVRDGKLMANEEMEKRIRRWQN